MGAQALDARERIRRRPEFERVYKDGVKVHGRFMTLFLMPNGLPHARLGVAATRKLGGAVVRNRAKRLAREIYRHHKLAAGYDVVIVPRREMLDAPYPSLQADYQGLLERRGRAARPRGPSRERERRAGSDPRV